MEKKYITIGLLMILQGTGIRYQYYCIAPQLRSTVDHPDDKLLGWVSSLRENARPGHTVEHTFCRSSKPQSWHSIRSCVRHTAL